MTLLPLDVRIIVDVMALHSVEYRRRSQRLVVVVEVWWNDLPHHEPCRRRRRGHAADVGQLVAVTVEGR